MSRLHEINCNKEQWLAIVNESEYTYTLVNQKTLHHYILYGDIIGIEQISDDEFLVFSVISRDEYEPGDKNRIERIQLQHSKIISIYRHDFYDNFGFLSEDTIIFYRDALLYSISKNAEVQDLARLITGVSNIDDLYYLSQRHIKSIYVKGNNYPIYLYVDYRLKNTNYSVEHLQFLLDANSLKPVTPIYSTLRNQYISLSDTFTLKDLVEEEISYLWIIQDFLFHLYNYSNMKTTEELLSMIEKTE